MMIIIAILLPWLSFFLRGKIFKGFICLIIQITIIGWLPAAIWAVYDKSESNNKKRFAEMEARIVGNQMK